MLMLLGGAVRADAAPKTDVVELANGDRITCEIRKLERGKLTVKTDGLGTISIEWDDVRHVTSTAIYDVELTSGQRLFGSLQRSDEGAVVVALADLSERLRLASIVRITPLGGNFWRRLDGSIDAGFSFTQANVQTQWTFNTSVDYRGRRWLYELDGNSSLTTREDADRQTRNTLTMQSQRFLGRRWSLLGLAQFQQNEELSLNLRTVVGGGIQRVLSQSNRMVTSVFAAAVVTQEVYSGADDETVAEGVAGGSLDFFTFDGRSTSLSLTAASFYALNRAARTRLELNTSFKSDIVGDLYWSVNLFESYNSDPPSGEKKNDSGVSASVGWTF